MPRSGSGNDAAVLELVCCHVPTQTWSYCAYVLASILWPPSTSLPLFVLFGFLVRMGLDWWLPLLPFLRTWQGWGHPHSLVLGETSTPSGSQLSDVGPCCCPIGNNYCFSSLTCPCENIGQGQFGRCLSPACVACCSCSGFPKELGRLAWCLHTQAQVFQF